MKTKTVSVGASELLSNRYQIKELIGTGGMAQVFLADDILLGGVEVAVKFLSQTLAETHLREDFAREARTCAALSQKSLHIVRVTDYGVNDRGKPFYVMEYLRGKSLKDFFPTPIPLFLALSKQICLGLQSAHQGIKIDGKIRPVVHRDIKPANIWVTPDPIFGQLVKILDFGIAKFLNSSGTIVTTKGFFGTLPYCSPEQMDGSELDSRSDIYSLGVMMFEMLTDKKPWKPETETFGAWYKAHHFQAPKTIAEVNPHLKLPPELNNLIVACLAKKAGSRPQNLGEILKIIESLEQLHDIPLPPPIIQPPIQPNSFPLPPTTIQPESKTNSFFNSPSLPPTTIQPESKTNSFLEITVEQACWQLSWPANKPKKEIVFPQLLEEPAVTSLMLMMSRAEITNRTRSSLCNDFLFVASPHPMLLWLTVMYSPQHGPKWLPCYLDLQNRSLQAIVEALAAFERYPITLFTLEAPHFCANVISSRISPAQRQMLLNWVALSQSTSPSNQAQLSKNLLLREYKQLQSRILQRLESAPALPSTIFNHSLRK